MALDLRSKSQLSELSVALSATRLYMPVNNAIFNEFYDRVRFLKSYEKTFSSYMNNVNYCIRLCKQVNGDRVKFNPIARSINVRGGNITGWLVEMIILKEDQPIKSVFIYSIG